MNISRRRFLLATSGAVTSFIIPPFYKNALDIRLVKPLAWVIDFDLDGPAIRTTTEFWLREIPLRTRTWSFKALGQRMQTSLESLRKVP